METDYINIIGKVVGKVENHLEYITQKELLHYEILTLMQKENLLETLTFAGGTSLRLCYNNARYSEDLDFVTQASYHPELFREFSVKAKEHFTDKLGIQIHVNEPKVLKAGYTGHNNFDHVNVDRWQISFLLAPNRPDIPRQRIKLEIASVPAYTREMIPMHSHYSDICIAPNILIPVESLPEIMADKLISFPASEKYIRYRDIWDLNWLAEKGIKPNIDLIKNKINDYHISDFEEKLVHRIQSLPSLFENEQFAIEMVRYLPLKVIEDIKKSGVESKIKETIHGLLENVYESLQFKKAYTNNYSVQLSNEAQNRINQIPFISGGNQPPAIFRDIAQEALKSYQGDIHKVNWQEIEKQTAVKAIGEFGYSPASVIRAVGEYSPTCITAQEKAKFTEVINKIAPDLQAQYQHKQQQNKSDKVR